MLELVLQDSHRSLAAGGREIGRRAGPPDVAAPRQDRGAAAPEAGDPRRRM
jgi:hypothetical protein